MKAGSAGPGIPQSGSSCESESLDGHDGQALGRDCVQGPSDLLSVSLLHAFPALGSVIGMTWTRGASVVMHEYGLFQVPSYRGKGTRTHRDRHTEIQRLTHLCCAPRSSMSAVSTIGVTAFSLAGRELAKVFVLRDVSVRMLVEALGAAAGISWDAWQLTWQGEALEDWSLQPFTDSELSSVELQVVLKPQPLQLEPEHEHAVELLEALKEPYDGLRGLSFALGSLRQLSLGAKDDDRCFKDCRGDESSGVMSEPQLNALSRAVLDGRLQCTVLCLRGVLRPMGMMGRAVHRQDSADLVSLLSHMPQLTSLDLSGNRLGYTNTCIEALGTAMPNLQKLTYLNFSCNGFFSFHGGSGMLPPHVSALFVSLLNLTALEVLDLSLNDKAFVRDFCKQKEELGSSYMPRLLKELPLKKLLFAANDAGLSTVEALEAARQPVCEIDYGLEDHVAKAIHAIQELQPQKCQTIPVDVHVGSVDGLPVSDCSKGVQRYHRVTTTKSC